jgi:hypothetical protein
MKVVEETKTCSKDEYLVINHTNTTKIKTKGMNALIHSIHKSLENTIKGVSDKYKNIYQYVTGRIKTPFNQFTKMIRIDYHYHQRMIKIYRNYTILTLQQFKNIYSRIIEDMTEELFKICFIEDNKLYIPFIHCLEDDKFYDMLKYIKGKKQYEILFYVIPF